MGHSLSIPSLDYVHVWECLLELQQAFCYQPENGDGQVQIKTPGALMGASNPDTPEIHPHSVLLICFRIEMKPQVWIFEGERNNGQKLRILVEAMKPSKVRCIMVKSTGCGVRCTCVGISILPFTVGPQERNVACGSWLEKIPLLCREESVNERWWKQRGLSGDSCPGDLQKLEPLPMELLTHLPKNQRSSGGDHAGPDAALCQQASQQIDNVHELPLYLVPDTGFQSIKYCFTSTSPVLYQFLLWPFPMWDHVGKGILRNTVAL
ncbi:uncharacterized protein [Equus przewalskii]|uniref:Uncharacterized protein n=1 Tax=Equus przewalskii TaxID=9798 RepID=A0ABM4PU51_EQUPR